MPRLMNRVGSLYKSVLTFVPEISKESFTLPIHAGRGKKKLNKINKKKIKLQRTTHTIDTPFLSQFIYFIYFKSPAR